VVLDMDSSESPAFGEQEQSGYNGYFGSFWFLFNSRGDCLTAKLRPANVHSPEGWEEQMPEIERQQRNGNEVVFRPDAALAKPEIYEALEERRMKYAIRLPANESLERDAVELLPRSVGRPSVKPLSSAQRASRGDKCWQRGRLELGNRPRRSTERRNEPCLPPNRGYGDLSLNRWSHRCMILRKRKVEIENSG
jgi:hypothetical protein